MIHYTQGNLLDAEAEALVNTVNTVGISGKGIELPRLAAEPRVRGNAAGARPPSGQLARPVYPPSPRTMTGSGLAWAFRERNGFIATAMCPRNAALAKVM